MKRLLPIILSLLLLDGCGHTKYIPIKEQVIVHQVDSIAWHDSTIVHNVYKEHYKDYTGLLDTLKMENTYSTFTAYNDTTANTLKGEIENKPISIPEKIKWKEKTVYKDSIQTKEVPVEVVETIIKTKYPKTYWLFLGLTIIGMLYIGIKLYLKFKI